MKMNQIIDDDVAARKMKKIVFVLFIIAVALHFYKKSILY